MKFFTLAIVLILIALTQSRAAGQLTPTIDPGKAMQPDPASLWSEEHKNRRAVIIYYANDCFPPVHNNPARYAWQELSFALKVRAKDEPEEMKRRLDELAERIVLDTSRLIKQSNEEINELTLLVRRYPNSGLFVIRNYGAVSTLTDAPLSIRDDHYIHLRWEARIGESEKISEGVMKKIPRFSDPHYKAQPLSNGIVLLSAIEAAAEHFGADKARFALIVKSMGSPDFLLAPMIRTEINDLIKNNQQGKICDVLCRELARDSRLRDIVDGEDKSIVFPTLNEILVREFNLDKEKGIAKQDFVNEIMWFGGGAPEKRMVFPMIVLDGNQTALDATSPDVVRNADLWAALNKNDNYSQLNLTNVGYLYERKGDWSPEQLDFTKLRQIAARNRCDDIHECLKLFLDLQSRSQ